MVSVTLGFAIITVNFLHYENVQRKYYEDFDQDEGILATGNIVSTSFSLDDPQSMDRASVRITYDQIEDSVAITPTINGRTYETEEGFIAGSTQIVVIEGPDLRTNNQVAIRSDLRNAFLQQGHISHIEVQGVTTAERYTFLGLGFFGVFIIIGPFLVLNYIRYNKRAKLEEQFPNFLRDVVEGTRAGMSLPQSIKNTQTNNYGDLTPYVNAMAAKLDWGIPFDTVMRDFGKKTNSKIIQRSISTVIQTYTAGGNVSEVLETIGNNLKEIRQLRKERESQIYGEMVTGYIVYFVFLVVLVVLVKYLLPALTFSGSVGPLGGNSLSAGQIVENYQNVFQFMIVVQSIFSGVVIGRLSEGKLGAGMKHVAILLPVGLLVTSVFL